MKQEILQMRGIKKSFGGVQALKNGELTLTAGEVHGLIGENGAGKSTLMNILIGIHKADAGTIAYKGQEICFRSPAEALKNGIAMIHQEISLVPEMSVTDNLWLGQENKFLENGLINKKKMEAAAEELLSGLGMTLDCGSRIKELSIANMQLVEVARAISHGADIIIMDEPTSALTTKEIDLLYDIVQHLALSGVTIIFISHKLPELFRFCSRVTIMRDGEFIETCQTAALKNDRLMQLIVGRENVESFSRGASSFGEVVLEVEKLTKEGVFSDISFKLRRGEIVGFCGLMGAGRTEIMDAIFGVAPFDSGALKVFGKSEHFKSPRAAMRCGLGMVTEDRLRMGAIRPMSILQNSTLACLESFVGRLPFLQLRREKKEFLDKAGALSLKYGSCEDLIGSLSGGNQQKVIFSRWLLAKSSILILDEPTRGIDVGAKTEIYKIIDTLSRQGISVLLVSSEMPELLSLCDRICVVREGRLVFECDKKDASQELLISKAFGFSEVEENG